MIFAYEIEKLQKFRETFKIGRGFGSDPKPSSLFGLMSVRGEIY